MVWNKPGAGSGLPAVTLPISLPAGSVFMVPAGQGVIGAFGSVLYPQLASGNTLTGQYLIQLGQYPTLQTYDAGLSYWRDVQVSPMALLPISSDGQNFRIANTTGTPVGVLITNAGSAYTNGFYGFQNAFNTSGQAGVIQGGITTLGNTTFTATPSAGGSTWNMIVGGAVSTTMGFS